MSRPQSLPLTQPQPLPPFTKQPDSLQTTTQNTKQGPRLINARRQSHYSVFFEQRLCLLEDSSHSAKRCSVNWREACRVCSPTTVYRHSGPDPKAPGTNQKLCYIEACAYCIQFKQRSRGSACVQGSVPHFLEHSGSPF